MFSISAHGFSGIEVRLAGDLGGAGRPEPSRYVTPERRAFQPCLKTSAEFTQLIEGSGGTGTRRPPVCAPDNVVRFSDALE